MIQNIYSIVGIYYYVLSKKIKFIFCLHCLNTSIQLKTIIVQVITIIHIKRIPVPIQNFTKWSNELSNSKYYLIRFPK